MAYYRTFVHSMIALSVVLCVQSLFAQEQRKPLSAEEFYLRGLAAVANDCSSALKDFDRAIVLEPKDARFYKERSGCLAESDPVKALADLNKAIALKPDFAGAYLARAIIYFGQFVRTRLDLNRDRALRDFDRAISLDPRCAECYSERSKLHFWAREPEAKVMSDLGKAIELAPSNKAYLARRANLYYLIDEYSKCISDYDAIVALDPKDADAFYMRGQSHFAQGSFQKSIDDYTMALKLKPIVAHVFLTPRAKAFRALGKIKEAEADEKRIALLNGQ